MCAWDSGRSLFRGDRWAPPQEDLGAHRRPSVRGGKPPSPSRASPRPAPRPRGRDHQDGGLEQRQQDGSRVQSGLDGLCFWTTLLGNALERLAASPRPSSFPARLPRPRPEPGQGGGRVGSDLGRGGLVGAGAVEETRQPDEEAPCAAGPTQGQSRPSGMSTLGPSQPSSTRPHPPAQRPPAPRPGLLLSLSWSPPLPAETTHPPCRTRKCEYPPRTVPPGPQPCSEARGAAERKPLTPSLPHREHVEGKCEGPVSASASGQQTQVGGPPAAASTSPGGPLGAASRPTDPSVDELPAPAPRPSSEDGSPSPGPSAPALHHPAWQQAVHPMAGPGHPRPPRRPCHRQNPFFLPAWDGAPPPSLPGCPWGL